MESIDELRREVCRDGSDRTVMLVADHIDKIEQEIKERYIELPSDADGETIHIGDMLQSELVCGGWCEPFEVETIEFYGDATFITDTAGLMHKCAETRHKPSTVEDVLEEALNKAANLDRKDGYWPSAADITNIVNEIAPKLQLREAE